MLAPESDQSTYTFITLVPHAVKVSTPELQLKKVPQGVVLRALVVHSFWGADTIKQEFLRTLKRLLRSKNTYSHNYFAFFLSNCVSIVNRLPNMLFYRQIWPNVPPDCHCLFCPFVCLAI